MTPVSICGVCANADMVEAGLEDVPSRLFVCFGLEAAFAWAADLRLFFATVDFFLVGEALRETLGLGAETGLVMGDRRKAEGEGIVMVAIDRVEEAFFFFSRSINLILFCHYFLS